MAVVRCPIHRIPYNDSNPRGCPACAQEKEGGAADVMQELARASQMGRRTSEAARTSVADFNGPVTTQPRVPVAGASPLARLLAALRRRRSLALAVVALAVLAGVLTFTTRNRFTAANNPVIYDGVVRPLPLMPGEPIALAFSALGPQPAEPHPTTRTIERYSYGRDLYVDAVNGVIYAITLSVPNRSWKGLRVGMPQTNAEGGLAMLGPPRNAEAPSETRPDTVSGYIVYRSLEQRPRRVLVSEVRPPNNCYDVLVDMQPRSIGTLLRRGEKFYAVSRVGGITEWVVTRIRVVSRSIPGPYAAAPVC